MVNTNDYIYRFISGELSGKRKHSEVINKILAGYIDSDGCIVRRDNMIEISLTQAMVNDPDFDIMRALHRHYKIGTLQYRISKNPKESIRCSWRIYGKSACKLIGLIGKHMIVKGKYADEAAKTYLAGTKFLIDRSSIGPVKTKKHPSTAWLAGYVAGDGHICCRLNRKRRKYDKKVDKYYNMTYNELYIVVTSDCKEPLAFLQEHYKGSIYDKGTYYVWKRSLGKGHKAFSLDFLTSIKPYMLHPKKYNNIQRMIKHLKGLAETKQVGDR